MLKSSRGSLTIAHVGGAPIRVHWTTLVGAVVLTGFALAPLRWAAFFLLVVVHELGHAALVRRYGYRVASIEVNGAGGACVWEGDPTSKEHAIIAWGGIAAQAVILVVALLVSAVGRPSFLEGFFDELISGNLALMVINLVPIPPLDGADAWRLVRILRDERRYR